MRRSFEAGAVGGARIRVFLETIAEAIAEAVLRDLDTHTKIGTDYVEDGEGLR